MPSNCITSRVHPDPTLVITASLWFSLYVYVFEYQRPSYFYTMSWLLAISHVWAIFTGFLLSSAPSIKAVLKSLPFSYRISSSTQPQPLPGEVTLNHLLTLLHADSSGAPQNHSDQNGFLFSSHLLHRHVSLSDHLLRFKGLRVLEPFILAAQT